MIAVHCNHRGPNSYEPGRLPTAPVAECGATANERKLTSTTALTFYPTEALSDIESQLRIPITVQISFYEPKLLFGGKASYHVLGGALSP